MHQQGGLPVRWGAWRTSERKSGGKQCEDRHKHESTEADADTASGKGVAKRGKTHNGGTRKTHASRSRDGPPGTHMSAGWRLSRRLGSGSSGRRSSTKDFSSSSETQDIGASIVTEDPGVSFQNQLHLDNHILEIDMKQQHDTVETSPSR